MTIQEFQADENLTGSTRAFLTSEAGQAFLLLLEGMDPAANLILNTSNIPAAVAETQGSALLLGASSATRKIINTLRDLQQNRPIRKPQSDKLGGGANLPEPPSITKP